jgi:hypothetical protein
MKLMHLILNKLTSHTEDTALSQLVSLAAVIIYSPIGLNKKGCKMIQITSFSDTGTDVKLGQNLVRINYTESESNLKTNEIQSYSFIIFNTSLYNSDLNI